MTTLLWVVGGLGVFGVTGVIAACVFVPAVAIPILRQIGLYIAGCKVCLVVLAIIVALIVGYFTGHHRAVVACKADALAAQLAAKQADLDNAKKAKTDADQRAQTIQDNANDQHTKDQEYIKSLESRPACALDDSDIAPSRVRH